MSWWAPEELQARGEHLNPRLEPPPVLWEAESGGHMLCFIFFLSLFIDKQETNILDVY